MIQESPGRRNPNLVHLKPAEIDDFIGQKRECPAGRPGVVSGDKGLDSEHPFSIVFSQNRCGGLDPVNGDGGVTEWSNVAVLKTVDPYRIRGFESHPHRQFNRIDYKR